MPDFLSPKSTVPNGTPARRGAMESRVANVLQFPSTPPFAGPRKRGRRSQAQLVAAIASNRPRLLEQIECEITNSWWNGGVSCGWLAKMHQLTIAQAEAVIWIELHRRFELQAELLEQRRAA